MTHLNLSKSHFIDNLFVDSLHKRTTVDEIKACCDSSSGRGEPFRKPFLFLIDLICLHNRKNPFSHGVESSFQYNHFRIICIIFFSNLCSAAMRNKKHSRRVMFKYRLVYLWHVAVWGLPNFDFVSNSQEKKWIDFVHLLYLKIVSNININCQYQYY